MARLMNRLTARTVATLKEPGRHADGGGLYLVVDASGAKRWVYLYRWRDNASVPGRGRLREMGLGSTLTVSLAEARQAAETARKQVAAGTDPIAAKRGAAAAAKVVTFGDAADALIEAMAPSFRNAKHVAQWRMTLTEYAAPLRAKPVDAIGTDDVLEVLKPIWLVKPETASRLRGRIEKVLDAAKVRGLRSGENPARWRGHLDLLLAKRTKASRGHHAALPYADVPALVARLRAVGGVSAAALEFVILTAARTGEVLGATWGEIDEAAKVWTIPASRMKGGRPHRVPLTDRALAILAAVRTIRHADDGHIFPGQRRGRPLSQMSLAMGLRRWEASDATTHGFRSSFRDWAGDKTTFSREVIEAALAHAIGDETEAAYRRGDAMDKRRKLMAAWAAYCEPRIGAREG